ncbi:hypothetical protein [Paraglaciecola sp. L3A3]|uniref:hypothetical protein n=1 Tax=Paraglaciecola sp. L3A3 TaxID=2686358 RepID=UPI00131BEA11|nr:hypothetical protein [Paraglaciecola sp. L3A3]
MAVSENSPRKRKRGIRASRVKLEEAMARAGYKTQASLAEAIADKENLDSIPKDVVSKVFRELLVAPSSIQRVANILEVEAYTLYKSAEEQKREYTITENESKIEKTAPIESIPATQPALNFRSLLLLILVVLIGVITTIITVNVLNTSSNMQIVKSISGKFANKKPTLGMFSLVIDADEKSRELLSIPTLKKTLQNNYTFSDYSQFSKTLDSELLPRDILNELQADFFLKLETTEFGGFVSTTAFLYSDNDVHNVWAISVRRSYIELDELLFIEDLVSTIEFETGVLPNYSSKFSETTNQLSMLDYMKGRNLLDQSQSN